MKTYARLSLLFFFVLGASVHAQEQEPSSEGAAEETLPDEVIRALDAAEQAYFEQLTEWAKTEPPARFEADENPFWLEDSQDNWSAIRFVFEQPSRLLDSSATGKMQNMRWLYEMGGVELRPLYVWLVEWFDELEREAEVQNRRMGFRTGRTVHPDVRQAAVDIVAEIDTILAAEADSASSTEPTTAPSPDASQESSTERTTPE